MPEARLDCLLGASVSGKDSVMRRARRRRAGRCDIVFARRDITPPPETGGADPAALAEVGFDARLRPV